jgi:hypothetical protein
MDSAKTGLAYNLSLLFIIMGESLIQLHLIPVRPFLAAHYESVSLVVVGDSVEDAAVEGVDVVLELGLRL